MNTRQTRSSHSLILVLACAVTLSILASAPARAAKANCACPANTTSDFYANPVVDRSSCLKDKTYAPTGVASPAVCSYPTLTAALQAAAAALVHDAQGARAIAAGGSPNAPAVFASESFPFAVTCGVTLTTADSPALGGGGFSPASYVILFNSTADHAITVHGSFSGFTVQNAGASTGSALGCSNENVSLASVRLDGANGASRLTNGLVLQGACSGTFSKMEVRNFGGAGVLVNSASPDSSEFVYVDLHHNQIGLKALSGNVVIEQDNQIQTQSRIHDNTGDGIMLGDPVDQSGIVTALIQNTVIDNNDTGLVVQQADTGAKSTHWTLFGTEIVLNRGTGLYVYPSFPVTYPSGATISGNVIGANGWPGGVATCIADLNSPPPGPSDETASQVVFDGVFPASAEATQACLAYDAEVNGSTDLVVACNADAANSCIYNSAAASFKCRPAWPFGTVAGLTGQPCTDTNANTIAGYHRSGPENEDIRVGVVAANGAWVRTTADHFLTSSFEQNQDWTAIGPESFAGNAGTVCSPTPSKCPPLPPVIPPIAP